MIRTFVTAAVLASPALALGATTWEIDGAHSQAGFTIRHMMVSNVKGSFGKLTGTIAIDDKDITKSVVDVTIDASTIDTADEKRDAHLRSADFFDVAKYPTITFASTKVEKGSNGHYKVTGNLTMHGVTKPVVLDAVWPNNERQDPWGNVKRGASATTTINRKDWGLNWNKTLEAGGLLVGDDVTITLELELGKKAAPKS
jgi:polyisoprenoid-binding protein YceI